MKTMQAKAQGKVKAEKDNKPKSAAKFGREQTVIGKKKAAEEKKKKELKKKAATPKKKKGLVKSVGKFLKGGGVLGMLLKK